MNTAVGSGSFGTVKNRVGAAVYISSVLFAVVLVLFVLFPGYIKTGVAAGLDLCREAVLPSLFPFAVLAAYFVIMEYPTRLALPLSRLSGFLFGRGGEVCAVFAAGLVCGFPVGARTAARAYREGQLGENAASVAAAFSNNPSPAFTIAFCGGLFDTPAAGFALFGLVSAAAVLAGACVCRLFPSDKEVFAGKRGDVPVLPSVTRSCIEGGAAMVTVCSFVTFFSAALALAEGLLPFDLSGAFAALFRGAFELTAGVSALSAAALPDFQSFITAAGLLSFSGLCANLQAIAFLSEEKLSIKPYLAGRAFTMIFSLLLSLPAGWLLFRV